MSLNRDEQKSVEAILARAQELAAGEQRPETLHAEMLAALADGTVSFEDLPDDAVEGCVKEFGADSVVDALIAAGGLAAPVMPQDSEVPTASAVVPWWRRLAAGIVSFWNRPMIPAMVAALAVIAAAAGTWLIYERWGSGGQDKAVLLTADSRPARPPRVPQDASGGKTPTTLAPHGPGARGSASTPQKSGSMTASPVPGAAIGAESQPRIAVAVAGTGRPIAHPITTTTTHPSASASHSPDVGNGATISNKLESADQPSTANHGTSAANHPATAASPPATGEVTTTAITERPYVAVYPHLGDGQPTTPGSSVATTSTPPLADPGTAAIQKKLELEYHLTKANDDKTDIVTAGSVVVLQKNKVLMLAASSTANPCRNTYKDGQIRQSGPCAGNEKLKAFSKFASHIPSSRSVPDSQSTHTFVTGEKFWITKIEVRDTGKDPGILFNFFTDEIGDAKTRYATSLLIPFGAFTPTPEQALKLVQEVITVASAEDAKADAKSDQQLPSQSAPQQPTAPPADSAPPAPPADPALIPTVSLGQSTDEVVANIGQPLKKVQMGAKTIYIYKDFKIIFVDGKVKDVQ